MSAATPATAPGPAPAQGTTTGEFVSPFADRDVSFVRMLRSEWLKLWTLRSTWWTLTLTVVVMAGLSLMFAAIVQLMMNQPQAMGGEGSPGSADLDLSGVAVIVVVVGYQLAQLTVAILGVLAMSSEYGSGMIRATFSAAPRRLRTLWAKLIVLTVTTVLVSVIGLALAWLVSYPILHGIDLAVDFSDASQIRSLVGTILYLVMIAWLSLGAATILRHTAGGISAVIALIMVLPMIFSMIVAVAPTVEWVAHVTRLLPSQAGERLVLGDSFQAFMAGGESTSAVAPLAPWTGFAVLAAYAVVALVVGAVVIKRRDA